MSDPPRSEDRKQHHSRHSRGRSRRILHRSPLETPKAHFTIHKCQKLLVDLVANFLTFFVVIWVDTEFINQIVGICSDSGLGFCDSLTTELLSEDLVPIAIPMKSGIKRHSRMMMVYRTQNLTRSDLAQQRIKDSG
jgi:hypothetical protein